MSEWDSWIAFIQGHAENEYMTKGPAESPAVWHFQIGGHDGSVYTKSAGFDAAYDASDMLKLSNAANGDTTDIFTKGPAGYTVMRCVDASSDFNVLTGKLKGGTGRLLYAARCTTTFVIALIDVTNCSRGAESKTMDAFSFAMSEGIGAGI